MQRQLTYGVGIMRLISDYQPQEPQDNEFVDSCWTNHRKLTPKGSRLHP